MPGASYNCSLDDLDAWQIIADHREFLACADKRKKAEQVVVYQKEASAMEVDLVLDIKGCGLILPCRYSLRILYC